jgi:ABC-type polysaccharide/polyol phosphate transport system ATPase subunit
MWALRFEDVTKQYRPGAGYRSLRQELTDRTGRPASKPALHDVSFQVEEGEAFAVIGPNGAGKSTALRIAARVTGPTSGCVRVRGRVGALIEVGAGIHPELTGRENIWLYGAILGLKRRDIAARFDSIVDFAELGDVLDRPVKRYSSGMQLRLGFSIAAGVEPDVLVVDEALAVGDARFQVRCLDRMSALVRSGTTVVYVSHDLASVGASCTRAALLVDGGLATVGPVTETLAAYVGWLEQQGSQGAGAVVFDADGQPQTSVASGAEMVIRVPLPAKQAGAVTVALGIRDGHPWNVLGSVTTVPARSGVDHIECHIGAVPLTAGFYQIWVSLDGDDRDGAWRQLGSFRVTEPHPQPRPLWVPAVAFTHEWRTR